MTEQEIMNLSGDALDDAVAISQGWHIEDDNQAKGHKAWFDSNNLSVNLVDFYHPSTNGSQCMEIMEREKIGVRFTDYGFWRAKIDNDKCCVSATGKTPNEAILRCFLLSKQ